MKSASVTVDEALVQEIVRRVLTACRPDRIILFGSAASGEMTPDSDIDLLVVEQNPSRDFHERQRVRRSLDGLGYSFDVFRIASESFEESKNVFGGIAYPAYRYGKVIYEAA